MVPFEFFIFQLNHRARYQKLVVDKPNFIITFLEQLESFTDKLWNKYYSIIYQIIIAYPKHQAICNSYGDSAP